MSATNDQILGAILYAAESPDYALRSLIFTDTQVIHVPLSKMSELVTRANQLPTTVAWILEAANPATLSGLGGLVGMKMWGDLKKKVSDKPVVKLDKGPLPRELSEAARAKLSYVEIKDVKIRKVMMSSDYLLSLGAGYWHTQKIVFDGRAVEDVKNLIKATPLASKLKE